MDWFIVAATGVWVEKKSGQICKDQNKNSIKKRLKKASRQKKTPGSKFAPLEYSQRKMVLRMEVLQSN
jgi:hypothetical protein